MEQLRFSEAETADFYNKEDQVYRKFWDKEGSLHWGFFEDLQSAGAQDFHAACQHWNEIMFQASGITAESRVLDLGCGNGNVAIWLAEKSKCEVVGVDLSDVRIANARSLAQEYPSLRVSFEVGSATDLAFPDESFTHVWSQATIYHVHEREKAVQESARVLQEGGTFIADDLVTPVDQVSDEANKYIYERLLFSPTFSAEKYRKTLADFKLLMLQQDDITEHLAKSYRLLSVLAQEHSARLHEAYGHMARLIEEGQLGWTFMRAEKVSDPVNWVYNSKNESTLRERYDAWAQNYDTDLSSRYRHSPNLSAKMLAEHLSDRSVQVLDVGAGTGMVGEALASHGFSNVLAVDLSRSMLQIAAEKNVYSELIEATVDKPLSFESGRKFDAAIAVGVYTYSHASPDSLEHIDAVLKPGAIFVLTIRAEYFEQNQNLQSKLHELSWVEFDRDQFTMFEQEAFLILAYRKQR